MNGSVVETETELQGLLDQRLKNISRVLLSELPLVVAVAGGIFLRLYQITLQVVSDDEWHALHALMTGSFSSIATHFGLADYCIPLALAFKASYLVCGLSESIMRFPVLFCGIGFLLVAPWMVRVWMGREISIAFAWLIAVSPLLIYYSRYSRPYIISVFLCFAAIFAFFEWWKGVSEHGRVVYLICAILGPYFHLSTLSFVVAPLGYALIESLVFKQHGSRVKRELAQVSALVFVGLGLLLAPPLIFDKSGWSEKLANQQVRLDSMWGSAELLAGTAAGWLVLAVLLLAVAGSVTLFHRQRRFGAYLMFLIASQIGANVMIGPAGLQVPIVFVRYSLPCLPLILILAAVAVSGLEEHVRKWVMVPGGTLAVLLGITLFLLGPLPQIYRYPNNWTNHGLFQYCYDPAARAFHYRFITRPRNIPEFYRDLGKHPNGSRKILEAPWFYEWHNNPFPHFQQVHRQQMLIGFVDHSEKFRRAGEYPANLERMRFRNFVHLSQHDELVARGVDYVVLHKDLASEVLNGPNIIPVDMGGWISEYRSIYGEPCFEDSTIVAFQINPDASR